MVEKLINQSTSTSSLRQKVNQSKRNEQLDNKESQIKSGKNKKCI